MVPKTIQHNPLAFSYQASGAALARKVRPAGPLVQVVGAAESRVAMAAEKRSHRFVADRKARLGEATPNLLPWH